MAEQVANPKFPVSSGLLEPRHWKAMGSAVWIYLVLLDWQTDEDGTVLHSDPVKASIISARLGCNERTVRRELERLESEGYIRRNRSGDGWLIWVTKPKKRFRTYLSRQPDRNVRPGQKCPISRTDMSGLSSSFPLKEDLNLSKRTKQDGRAREDRLTSIFETIQGEHPKGHNPKPNLAAQAFLSRFDSDAEADECLRQHREKWQPVWRAGRRVPDLNTWIRDYDPAADIAVDAEPVPPPEPTVAERMARIRAEKEART